MNIPVYRTIYKDGHPALKVAETVDADYNDYISINENVYNICINGLKMHENYEEYLYVFAFNRKNKLLGIHELSHGTHGSTTIGTKELFTFLLLIGADRFVEVHNHPGDIIKPSLADLKTVSNIESMSNTFEIDYHDALIIGTENYTSYKKVNVTLAMPFSDIDYATSATTASCAISIAKESYVEDSAFELCIGGDFYPIDEEAYDVIKAILDVDDESKVA